MLDNAKIAIILTYSALTLSILGLSWFGLYKLAKNSSTFEHFYKFRKAMKDSFYYLLSMPFTIMTFLMLVRIYKVVKYRQPRYPKIMLRDYSSYIILQWLKSLIILLFSPFTMVVVVLPWRLYETWQVVKTLKSMRARFYILVQAVHTLIDFILCPLPALLVILTLYRLPKLARKLDPKHGSRWRKHIMQAGGIVLIDILHLLMAIALFATIFMGIILVGRILYANERKFRAIRREIRRTFYDFLLFYAPAAVIEILTIIFLLLNVWRICLLPNNLRSLKRSDFTISKRFVFLLKSMANFFLDYLFAPLFLLSFLQVWRLPLIIKIYKEHLLKDNHYYAIIKCFASMICFIALVIIWSLFTIIALWRIPLLLKLLNAVNYSNADSKQEPLNQITFYGTEFRGLAYFVEQVIKDYIVLPIVLLLIVTVFHLPLVIRILCADFGDVSLFKRRTLEAKRRGLLYHCALKVLIELFTLLKLLFVIIMFWRLPFLFRSIILAPEREVPNEELEDIKALHSTF